MAPPLEEKEFWRTSRLNIEGRTVTIYDWPSDRPVYLCKPNQNTPRDYVQVPYFSLNDPKISKGRDNQETFDTELRRFIRQFEGSDEASSVMVVRCKEVPWLVGFIASKSLLVPATSFIDPHDMQESESPNLISRGQPCRPIAYGETVYADISVECEKLKRIIRVGTDKDPASEEDIRELQEQLSKVSIDPNLTLTTEHILTEEVLTVLTTEPAHLTFLARNGPFRAISSYSCDKESSCITFEAFVAKLAWAYNRFKVREIWSTQKTIISPAHDPRNMIYGWVFYDEETQEQSYVGIFYPLIQKQAKGAGKEGSSYCTRLACHLASRFKTDPITHLELNPDWDISNENSAWDLLIYPRHLHKE